MTKHILILATSALTTMVLTQCKSTTYASDVFKRDFGEEKSQIVDSISKIATNYVWYANSCSGCISGTYKYGYLFYSINDTTYLLKIDNYRRYYPFRAGHQVITVAQKNRTLLFDETIIDNEPMLSHGDYRELTISLGSETKKRTFYDSHIEPRFSFFIEILIATANEYEAHPWYWQEGGAYVLSN